MFCFRAFKNCCRIKDIKEWDGLKSDDNTFTRLCIESNIDYVDVCYKNQQKSREFKYTRHVVTFTRYQTMLEFNVLICRSA